MGSTYFFVCLFQEPLILDDDPLMGSLSNDAGPVIGRHGKRKPPPRDLGQAAFTPNPLPQRGGGTMLNGKGGAYRAKTGLQLA